MRNSSEPWNTGAYDINSRANRNVCICTCLLSWHWVTPGGYFWSSNSRKQDSELDRYQFPGHQKSRQGRKLRWIFSRVREPFEREWVFFLAVAGWECLRVQSSYQITARYPLFTYCRRHENNRPIAQLVLPTKAWFKIDDRRCRAVFSALPVWRPNHYVWQVGTSAHDNSNIQRSR